MNLSNLTIGSQSNVVEGANQTSHQYLQLHHEDTKDEFEITPLPMLNEMMHSM